MNVDDIVLTMDEVTEKKVRSRIIDVVGSYPCVTLSMLHPALSSYHKEWRLLFEQMIKEGVIKRSVVMVRNRISYRFSLAEPTTLK